MGMNGMEKSPAANMVIFLPSNNEINLADFSPSIHADSQLLNDRPSTEQVSCTPHYSTFDTHDRALDQSCRQAQGVPTKL